MVLPAFSFEATVSAEDARQDKIQCQIGHGAILGDEDDAWFFLNYLGSPPRHGEDEAEAYGRNFSRPRRHSFLPLLWATIRDRANARFPPSLFEGRLRVIRRGASRAPALWPLGTLLSLNPTRFRVRKGLPMPANEFGNGGALSRRAGMRKNVPEKRLMRLHPSSVNFVNFREACRPFPVGNSRRFWANSISAKDAR